MSGDPGRRRYAAAVCRHVEQTGQKLLERGSTDADGIYADAGALLLRTLAHTLVPQTGGLPAASTIDRLLPPPAQEVAVAPHPFLLSGPPSQVLSLAHEELLRRRGVIEAERFRLRPAPGRRRDSGIFYTPEPIARRVVHAALNATPLSAPTVLDPAMGTGVFLVAAVRALAQGVRSPRAVAESAIYGMDQDPIALRLAILALWLETGADPAALAAHLVCADALAADFPASDVVLSNPPWGMDIEGTDSFKWFAAGAADSARAAVGLVLPQAILCQTTHADARRSLLARLDPYAVLDLGNGWFGQAAAPACGLIFGLRPGPRRIALTHMRPRHKVRHRTIPRSAWSEHGFPVAEAVALTLLARLQRSHPALGTLGHVFRIHDSGINYSRAEIARAALYRAECAQDPRDLPRYRGACFHRYTGVRQDGWVRHEWAHGTRAQAGLAFDRSLPLVPEKIVLRQTADRIIATLDRSGMVMGRSVIAVSATDRVSLLALLACLNSKLLLGLYRALAGEEGRILPQVKVARLRALPVPGACAAGSQEWQTLASLGEAMLAAEGRDVDLDRAIDAQVSRLYG